MSRESSSLSIFQLIHQDLLSLMQLNKNYSNFHKTIITALQKSEFLSPNLQNSEGPKIVLNTSTLNLLVESSKSLLETDLLNTKTLKSLTHSFKSLSKSLQLPTSLKQDLNIMKSSLKSFASFFFESCEKLKNFIEILNSNLLESHKMKIEKIKNNIEKCLLGVLPKGILELKPLNFDEILVNLFQPVFPETSAPQLKKLKDYSKTTQEQLTCLTKKLAETYWELIPRPLKKRTSRQSLEKELKSSKTTAEKKTDKNLTKEENLIKKGVKAVRPLELKQISFTKEDSLSEGPVTETRIKPGVNKSYFGLGLDKQKVNKSYSNLKRKKSSTKALPRNSSNSHLRSNRSSSKKAKFE